MDIVPASQWRTLDWRLSPTIVTPSPELYLHHGASGTSSLATLIAYERHHVLGNGWAGGLGYNFAIAAGRIYEGRGAGRQGAQVRGRNRLSHGIVICGDYTSRDPADRDLDALVWLVRHGHEQGWWPSTITGGHRDAPGASTACPARLRHFIPEVNLRATRSAPPQEDDDMAASMLTRISNSDAVYQFAGQFLIPVTSPAQAAVIVDHAGLEPGKTAAQIDSGNLWQKHVGNLSKGEAGHFTIVEALPSGGGGLDQAQADSRYAPRSHRHTATVDLA